MDENPERRRYYPDEENVPLSVAIEEAVRAHEGAPPLSNDFDLYDHVDPDAIDMLFTDTAGADISVQFRLPDVTVSVWSDGGVDIRVTDTHG